MSSMEVQDLQYVQFKGDSSMKRFLSTASRTSVFFVALVGMCATAHDVSAKPMAELSVSQNISRSQLMESFSSVGQVVPAPATSGKGEPNPKNVRSSSLH